jgi:aspartokinase
VELYKAEVDGVYTADPHTVSPFNMIIFAQ